jgi:hypothetical protein
MIYLLGSSNDSHTVSSFSMYSPDLVATEGKYAWGAGLYFWMEHSKEGSTCHTESLKNLDFGGTLNNING